MDSWDLAIIGAAVLAHSAVAGRLKASIVTAAMFFTAIGLVAGELPGRFAGPGTDDTLAALTTAALTLVLFTDASRVDLGHLRRDRAGPIRLLGIGLPLTIVLGTGVALLVLDQLSLWPAAILATILAPTDAALGGPTVTDQNVPERVRLSLNVESGLNDGLCVPLLAIFLALAAVEESITTRSALHIVAEEVGWGLGAGLAAGAVGAWVLVAAGRRRWMEDAGRQVAMLAIPVLAFGAADALHGSGFIAAFVAGATVRALAADHLPERHLVEDLGDVLTGATFLVFGAIALGPALRELDGNIVLYAVLSLAAIRGIGVALAYVGSGVRAPTVAFVGWFGPRGLASIVFALDLLEAPALDETGLIVVTVAVTVGLSILLHGLTGVPGARRYGAWYTTHPRRAELTEHST
jgi:NhaP-type Na+/H+ or K+/H+ antiporter